MTEVLLPNVDDNEQQNNFVFHSGILNNEREMYDGCIAYSQKAINVNDFDGFCNLANL